MQEFWGTVGGCELFGHCYGEYMGFDPWGGMKVGTLLWEMLSAQGEAGAAAESKLLQKS